MIRPIFLMTLLFFVDFLVYLSVERAPDDDRGSSLILRRKVLTGLGSSTGPTIYYMLSEGLKNGSFRSLSLSRGIGYWL